MTHPKLFIGGTENVPGKKNSWINFHFIPDGCKIVFNLGNRNGFYLILKITWPKVEKIFTKSTLEFWNV